MLNIRKYKILLILTYICIFLLGAKALFHGFPDIERFFPEWMDERLTLTYIMKFGTLNFAPTQIWHPPLYHYLTFMPIALFYLFGKLFGAFPGKVEFIRFYFNNTQYFFLIGRLMSYTFYWLSALMIFKALRLFYNARVAHITTMAFLLVPRFIFDYSTTRPEGLLFLNSSIFFYFVARYYLDKTKLRYAHLAAFFLGVAIATKYNAFFLGSIFLVLLPDLKAKAAFRMIALAFLGFFICDPFFLIQAKKYLYNFLMYNREMRYYWTGISGATLGLTHLKQLGSLIYINFLGVLILFLGGLALLKKDARLFILAALPVFVYEVYFGLFQNAYSPLYLLNPLLPLAMLIFAAGINSILQQKKQFSLIICAFFLLIAYNYLGLWRGLSFGPTHLQKARAYIEKTIPEYANIGILTTSCFPQLNMTRQSYWHLMQTAPKVKTIENHELDYKEMDSLRYDDALRQIRIESLAKKPQYNLIRWDGQIATKEGALKFLKDNKIAYLVSIGPATIGKEDFEKAVEAASLLARFEVSNLRVYRDTPVYIYRINQDLK